MDLEKEIQRVETDFKKLEDKRRELGTDQKAIMQEQFRLQGERRLLTKLKGEEKPAEERGA